MKNILFLVVIFLLGASSAAAATLLGTAHDSEVAVIANAHIVIHWDASGSNYLKDNTGIKADVTAIADSNGGFFVELPPGFYDIFVTATSFSPHCDKVRLKGTEKYKFDVKLKVSPLTSKELD